MEVQLNTSQGLAQQLSEENQRMKKQIADQQIGLRQSQEFKAQAETYKQQIAGLRDSMSKKDDLLKQVQESNQRRTDQLQQTIDQL